jgi:hypothetical protein
MMGPAPIFDWFYKGEITPDLTVGFDFTLLSYSLFGLSVLFLILLLVSTIKIKKASVLFSFLSGLFFVISMYLGFMLSIV